MIELGMDEKILCETAGGPTPTGTGRKWLALLAWLLGLWLMIFVLAPWLQRHNESLTQLGNYINASGIEAGAIYYTEVPEVGEADIYIRDHFRFFMNSQKDKIQPGE